MRYDEPFTHCVFDNFLNEDLANRLSDEFEDFNSDRWYTYENPLEVKKTIHDWYCFPSNTYQFLSYLNSSTFIDELKKITGTESLYPDQGLHGAGWHIHGKGGKLNVHLDYEIHPKLNLLRKYNLIYYLSKDWKPEWGGNLQFWSHDAENNLPKEKVVTVDCKFNRAVLFDASQNSWHGFPEPIDCPEGVYRKSIAMYYLSDVPENIENRKRALYSPTEEQKNSVEIIELIKKRTI
jgi:Rps23 Pro-64 3,4-dihydroxylase Tpa1-like proline 4-hydroxylase